MEMSEVNDMGNMGDLSESFDMEPSRVFHPSQVPDMDLLYQDLQAIILVDLKRWRESEPGCFSFVTGLNPVPADREIASAGCLIWKPDAENRGTIVDATVLPAMHPKQFSSWFAVLACAKMALAENGGDSWKTSSYAKLILF
jgi:hypothetical protein